MKPSRRNIAAIERMKQQTRPPKMSKYAAKRALQIANAREEEDA